MTKQTNMTNTNNSKSKAVGFASSRRIEAETEKSWLHRTFFSIYSYTVFYALFGVLSLCYHSCFNSSLSTLEKRYHFSSKTGGYIMITDNIATVLTNLFIGYYGKTAHKPRWMAIGCAVSGLSVMLTAVPYFIYGSADEQDLAFFANSTLSIKASDNDALCTNNGGEENCNQQQATKLMTMIAVAIFAVSNFFRGFGTSIYFTYGTPYLDDNISNSKMPTFFALIFAARIFGAPLGFYITSVALKFYENPFHLPENMTNTDPRWVGAWWVGFLFAGVLMMLLAVPLAFFPREFKKKQKQISAQDLEASALSNGNEVELGDQDLQVATISQSVSKANEADEKAKPKQELSLRELPGEIYAIVTNPIIACQMIGNLFRGIGVIGYYVFQPKYIEAQFHQTASKASLTTGTTGVLSKIGGVLIGGILITLCKPKARMLTTIIFIVELTSVLTLLYGASVVGPQLAYPGTTIDPKTNLMTLTNTCNANCNCDFTKYQPICDPQSKNAWFSPCHGGCSHSLKNTDGSITYTECSCVENQFHSARKCSADDDKMIRYATIIAIGSMISGSSRAGNMVTFFRSVTSDQKSLAVAVFSFWHSLFVSIPYPLIYGAIFDTSCQFWSNSCGTRGNCWSYDTTKLRYIFHTVSIILVAIGSVFDFVMIFLSPRLGDLYGDQKQTNNKTNKMLNKLKFWKSQSAVLSTGDTKKEPKQNNEATNKKTADRKKNDKTEIELKNFVENTD